MSIETIFFDIGGVLLDIHPERTVGHIADILKMPPEDVKKLYPMEAHDQYEKGQITDEEFYHTVHQKLPNGKILSEDEFWAAWRKLVGKETGASEFLKICKKKHSVWLLSNTNARHIENGVGNQYSFFKDVDGAVYSYKVNARKPEPGIYEMALLMAGAAAEKSLFIDDQEENIVQAKSMGFHTIHFTTTDNLKTQLRELGLL